MGGFSPRVAVSNLYACRSIIDADASFKKSCDLCCKNPACLWKDCNKCRVKQMHDYIVEMLRDNIKTTEEEEV